MAAMGSAVPARRNALWLMTPTEKYVKNGRELTIKKPSKIWRVFLI
jgi:hypothetical protein